MMTLGAKKFDRYLLPDFPGLGVLAAVGIGAEAGSVRSPTSGPRAGRQPWPRRALLASCWRCSPPGLPTRRIPYYLSYYNPLLGGGPAAQRTVMVGNGEGLDQVAAWLNAQPERRRSAGWSRTPSTSSRR